MILLIHLLGPTGSKNDYVVIYNTNINAGNFVVKKNEFKIDEEIWYICYDYNGLYKWLNAKIVSRKSSYTHLIDVMLIETLFKMNAVKLCKTCISINIEIEHKK